MANPKMKPAEVLTHARSICLSYQRQRLELTLRQLYYRFVATGLIPNGQDQYKRIKRTLAQARLDGKFPLDWVVDRTRSNAPGDYTEDLTDLDAALDSCGEAIRSFPWWYVRRDRWMNQPIHVSVWVEKEALSGVFQRPCKNLGVSWFALKGYPSHASVYRWIRDTHKAMQASGAERAVVLYFGDHDPDGLKIPETTEAVVRNFMRQMGLFFPLEFRQVALTMDQIEKYDPPPFPAKFTSSRYAGYVAATGTTDAWELDALEPSVLQDLIRLHVGTCWTQSIKDRNDAEVRQGRQDLVERLKAEGWADDALAELQDFSDKDED